MEKYVYMALTALVSSFIGSYIGSYFKKKGENRAAHENFKQLLAELKETTHATKQIEAKISDEVWDRQREWEFKRDALLEGGRAIADFLASVMRLSAVYATKGEAKEDEEIAYLQALGKSEQDALDAVNDAAYSLQRAQLVISIVSGKSTQIAFVKTERLFKQVTVKIIEGDTEYLKRELPRLRDYGSNLTLAIRRELGFDDSEFTSQSNVSSASPTPD